MIREFKRLIETSFLIPKKKKIKKNKRKKFLSVCVCFISENYIKNEQTIMLWNQQKLLRKELDTQKKKRRNQIQNRKKKIFVCAYCC